MAEEMKRKYGLNTTSASTLSLPVADIISGNEAMKSPVAGTGSPMKDDACLVSLLNLARRMAAKTAIKNARHGMMSKCVMLQ